MSKRASTLLSPEKRRALQKKRAVEDIAERHGEIAESSSGEDQDAPVQAEAPEEVSEEAPAEAAPEPAGGSAPEPAPAPDTRSSGASELPAAGKSADSAGSRFRPPVLFLAVASVAILGGLFFALAPGIIENGQNKVTPHEPYEISAAAAELHAKLVVGDLHADSLLWARDLTGRGERGHSDLPRMAEGNVALQVFGVVTAVPGDLNYEENSLDSDSITGLAVAQLWPVSTWGSLLARALYQGEKLHDISARSGGALRIIRSRSDAEALLTARAEGHAVIGGILSFEGAQVLEGDVANVQRLYDAGYRVMGLQHFFDNELGGSLHGASKAGLTPFGREAVTAMTRLGVIIDLAHASEAVVRDVLGMRVKRLIISHTGVKGACDTARNIPDALMKRVAASGGLIGIGFWDAAVCDISPAGVVKSIRYAVDLVGVDHVALGSDFDGATTTAFDASELAVLTHEMLEAGFTEIEIRLVMGGNMAGFFLQNLPG